MNAGRGKGCGPGSRSWYEEHAQSNEKGLCNLNSQRLPLLPLPLQRPAGAGDSRGQWYQWLEPVYSPTARLHPTHAHACVGGGGVTALIFKSLVNAKRYINLLRGGAATWSATLGQLSPSRKLALELLQRLCCALESGWHFRLTPSSCPTPH